MNVVNYVYIHIYLHLAFTLQRLSRFSVSQALKNKASKITRLHECIPNQECKVASQKAIGMAFNPSMGFSSFFFNLLSDMHFLPLIYSLHCGWFEFPRKSNFLLGRCFMWGLSLITWEILYVVVATMVHVTLIIYHGLLFHYSIWIHLTSVWCAINLVNQWWMKCCSTHSFGMMVGSFNAQLFYYFVEHLIGED